jgi:hypothetical protein
MQVAVAVLASALAVGGCAAHVQATVTAPAPATSSGPPPELQRLVSD